MRIYVNRAYFGSQINTYTLGPFRLELWDFLADAYNRIMEAHQAARDEFARKNGFPWEPAFLLELPTFSEYDMDCFMRVGKKIQAVAKYHDFIFKTRFIRAEHSEELLLIRLQEDMYP